MQSITDIEQALVGACMLEPRIAQVSSILKPGNFSCVDCRAIFAAMLQMYPTQSIDILTVTEHMTKTGTIKTLSLGARSIIQTTNRVASAANVEFHARIILENSLRSNFLEILKEHYINEKSDIIKAVLADTMGAVNRNELNLFELIEAMPRILARLGATDTGTYEDFALNVDERMMQTLERQQANTILRHLLQLPYQCNNAHSKQAMQLLAEMITMCYSRGCPAPQLTRIQTMYNSFITSY